MSANIDHSTSESLYRIRHSLAHIMAEAVLELRPGTKLGFGPPIEDGFYYDFILSAPITEEDFPEIEKKMRRLIQENHAFNREELPKEQALARLTEMGEPYKREYAEELLEKKGLSQLTFYRTGPFLDMCDGPHVETSRNLPQQGFKLRSLAGAYWRGDSKNSMMTRIYAWAFETKAELDARIKAYKEAQERDHKKLGKELDIFVIDVNLEVTHSLSELFQFKSAVSIIVHDFELSTKADKTAATSSFQGISQPLNKDSLEFRSIQRSSQRCMFV